MCSVRAQSPVIVKVALQYPSRADKFFFIALVAAAIESRVSLPRLEKLDWRVDVVAGSSESAPAAGGVPVVLLDCTVRDQPTFDSDMPSSRHVTAELDAASLGALLDGMRRIKDQLAAAVQ